MTFETSPFHNPVDPHSFASAQPTSARRLPWSWLEGFVLLQTLAPALLFIPGADALRMLTRILAFASAILVGLWVWSQPKRPGVGRQAFAPQPWLLAGLAWMAVSIGHPDTNSLLAGVAAVVLSAAVCAPAFWAGELMESPRRLTRLMAILFLCQALNAGVGLLQSGWPSLFLPPGLKDPVKQKELLGIGHAYLSGGQIIVRPSGLTDQAGAASAAGAATALLGLAWALAPSTSLRRSWLRWAALALAAVGAATIFFTLVRAAMAILAISLFAFFVLLWRLKRYRELSWLTALIGVGGLAVVLWVASTGAGGRILDRFATLIEGDPTQLYAQNRGGFVADAFGTMIWEFPLGGGLGRWGMVHQHFGDHQTVGRGEAYWVEIQWSGWILDGGFILLIAGSGAVFLALRDLYRIAAHPRLDPELRYWTAAAFALCLSIAALTFSYVPFQSPLGMQFWLLAAAAHGASRALRADY